MSMDVCIKSACSCQTIFCLEILFCYRSFSSFTHRKMWTSATVERVLLCFTFHISSKLSMMQWMSVCVTSFPEEYCSFSQFFGVPQNNIWQNPCMILIRNIGQNQSLHCLPLFWNLFWSISGIGLLKNKNVALCGMTNTNLTKSIKILRVHTSYNKKIQFDLNFTKTIKNLCNVIKLWCMRKTNFGRKNNF